MAEPGPQSPPAELAGLRRLFDAGGRPSGQHGVGVEHEKIAVRPDGTAPAHPGEIETVLERLHAAGGWRRIEDDGHLIGLKRGMSSVSIEPGGQFEYSDRPQPSAALAAAALDAHLADLDGPARAVGLTWLAAGFRPFGTIDEVPWMPKGRYRVMRDYLPARGRLAHEMMKRTATVQANLDYVDEADCADMVRVSLGIAPLVTALWANSPIVDGKPSGYQSYRAACWLETDPDRCGLLPFALADDAEEHLFERYVEWALDVPMFFVYRGGRYLPAGGTSFRRFLADGFQGEVATVDDWELHLSTLFPEVRLRPHIEVRSADAGTLGMVKALPALYRGLLYDAGARRAAWALVSGWTLDEREALRRTVPQSGLQTPLPGGRPGTLLDLAPPLVAAARAGLSRLGDDDLSLLDPVDEVAASGRSHADRVLDAWHAASGDAGKLVAALRLT